MCKLQKHEKLLLVTVQKIQQQGSFNFTTVDYLIAAEVYVGYRSKQPDKETLSGDLKDLKENDINVNQLVELEKKTANKQNRPYQEEVQYRDTGVGNGTQPPAILNILDN